MARHELDREDLIREAVALRHRAELTVPGEAELVVAGFRDDGRLSVYFGPDAVYHFDPHGRLRRAFVEGLLFRLEGRVLARLSRRREPDETVLVRVDLEGSPLDEFVRTMRERMDRLLSALRNQSVQIVRQVPTDDPITERLIPALETVVSLESSLAPRG